MTRQTYLVIICKDKTIHLWPADSIPKARVKLHEIMKNPKTAARYASHKIIRTSVDNWDTNISLSVTQSSSHTIDFDLK